MLLGRMMVTMNVFLSTLKTLSKESKEFALTVILSSFLLLSGFMTCSLSLISGGFSDQNFYLMIGSGMVFSGMCIFGFGSFLNLIHGTKSTKPPL
jgi:hypothetical protein